ncbi:MAG: hypothetical protein PHD70_14085, partial [Anaerostipes sp.]|nr:hypothetical protein [Anaerostipes sp.]
MLKNATEYFLWLPNGSLFAMLKCRNIFLFSGEKPIKPDFFLKRNLIEFPYSMATQTQLGAISENQAANPTKEQLSKTVGCFFVDLDPDCSRNDL